MKAKYKAKPLYVLFIFKLRFWFSLLNLVKDM